MNAAARPVLPPDSPVTATVYSMVWPQTEQLLRRAAIESLDDMLARHRSAHTKRQDAMHDSFFDAWRSWAAPCVTFDDHQFPERYPSAGSSEAIREVIRSALWRHQDLVVFDGEYEGYEAIAVMQGTVVHRVPRAQWRAVLDHWRVAGAPWGDRGAQWWISQPSAIDGNVWAEFDAWLDATASWSALEVWFDACYVGMCSAPIAIDLTRRPQVAGLVFSLSKVMGAYYRRIGGCWTRAPQPGLWGNRWFKNLDSLYLGELFLKETGTAAVFGRRHAEIQARALAVEWSPFQADWAAMGISWRPSDVPLLVCSDQVNAVVPDGHPLRVYWDAARRGTDAPAGRRLCLTPTIDRLLAAPPSP